LIPYSPQMYDGTAYAAMRETRAPFVRIHEYAFYALLGLIVLHIAAVVITEIRGGGNLVSAMFTGKRSCGRPWPIATRTPAPEHP
jgi:Ni/Fe-hydrogenase 1 B-type cytochrome subunit